MTEPRFNKIVSLNEHENKRLENLRKIGYKIIDVFRRGIEELEKVVKK